MVRASRLQSGGSLVRAQQGPHWLSRSYEVFHRNSFFICIQFGIQRASNLPLRDRFTSWFLGLLFYIVFQYSPSLWHHPRLQIRNNPQAMKYLFFLLLFAAYNTHLQSKSIVQMLLLDLISKALSDWMAILENQVLRFMGMLLRAYPDPPSVVIPRNEESCL